MPKPVEPNSASTTGTQDAETITLYGVPHSLYVAKVRIALLHKAAVFREMPPPGGLKSDAYAALVPQQTIPAIACDGRVLAESQAILEWLEERFPVPQMLPGNIDSRAQQRMLCAFHDTRLEPALRLLFPLVRVPDENALATAKTRIVLRLQQLAKTVSPAPYIAGPQLGLADCGFAVTFLWIEELSNALNLGITFPDLLQTYRQFITTDPSVAQVLSTYLPEARGWIEKTRNRNPS